MDDFYKKINAIRFRRMHPDYKEPTGYFPTPKAQKLMSVKSNVSTFGCSELSDYEKLQTLNQLAIKLAK